MEDKSILITGASRGLGFEMAKRLAKSGYQVIGTATSGEGVAKIANVGGCQVVAARLYGGIATLLFIVWKRAVQHALRRSR